MATWTLQIFKIFFFIYGINKTIFLVELGLKNLEVQCVLFTSKNKHIYELKKQKAGVSENFFQ